MIYSFTYDSITTETEHLIDLQSNFGMKALFKETPCTEFWEHIQGRRQKNFQRGGNKNGASTNY